MGGKKTLCINVPGLYMTVTFSSQECTMEVYSGYPSNAGSKMSVSRCHGKHLPKGLKLRRCGQKCVQNVFPLSKNAKIFTIAAVKFVLIFPHREDFKFLFNLK